MTVLEMAEKYYPDYWGNDRLDALVAAGKLTKAQAKDIVAAKEARNESD